MKTTFRHLLVVSGMIITLMLVTAGTVWARVGQQTDTLSDGSVKLRVGNEATGSGRLDVNNAAPGDRGFTVYPLSNTGKLTGCLGVSIPAVTDIPAQTGKYADGHGDLGAATEVAMFLDIDGNNEWSPGDVGLNADGATYS
ncbi:MAG TPA: hypothetical protein VEI27_02750, partial [Dehalococcoidales bacterium]|nr:hypothetical protein [Dehalococcoidales bacterium]